MTLWLGNLLAYSVQLAVLVGAGALLMALVRVRGPRATLRFWQCLLAASVLSPLYQLVTPGAPFRASPGSALSIKALSFPAETIAGMRAGVFELAPSVAPAVLAVLVSGVIFRLLWIGAGLARLRTIRATSLPAASLTEIADALGDELGVRADIRFSEAVASPATIGVRRPTILVPHRLGTLPRVVQRAVLCHELLHVRRHDWLTTLGEELWCAVLWFHPAARALVSRLVLARETLVDEATIAHTRDRRAYARALLEFSTAQPRLAGATALIGRRHLQHRIALIATEVRMTRVSVAVRLSMAALVVAIATGAATSVLPLTATLAAQAGTVYRPDVDQGVTAPQVVTEVKPAYTAKAMQARIEGSVWLTAVVLPSGEVGEVRVERSLDTEHGLDEAAVAAVRQWTFKPGTKDGKPVAVAVTIEMTFTLKQ